MQQQSFFGKTKCVTPCVILIANYYFTILNKPIKLSLTQSFLVKTHIIILPFDSSKKIVTVHSTGKKPNQILFAVSFFECI